MKDRYEIILEAIEAERKFEELFYKESISSRSVKEKVNLGFAWYPVKLLSKYYTIGENVEVELERKKEFSAPHKIKEGVGVRLSAQFKGEDIEFNGTVSFLRKDKMRILLRTDAISKDALPDWANYAVEMVYDERPYQVMKDSIVSVMQQKNGPLKALREGIRMKNLLEDTGDFSLNYEHKHLNASQLHAVSSCLNSNQFSIIHGPPGTGKTTTLVALVAELAKVEKRVLVCAPSNNATDLLAALLDQRGLKVLRLGNVTRIGDEIAHLTLDEKARNHAEWNRIKKIRIEAEEAKKMAHQHKRKYGFEQKEERRDLINESRELIKWARTLENKITSEIIEEAQVILTTLIGSASDVIDGLKFKTVVIDEASQTLEAECWTAMLKAEKVILAGDHQQLPPTVKSKGAKDLGFEETLLDRMTSFCKHSYLLNVQYRMNNVILDFPNQQFYNGKLVSHESVAFRTLPNDNRQLVFIDTAGTGFDEKFNHEYRSLSNEGEYFVIREHLLQSKENMIGYSIGIITPYADQYRFIVAQIAEDEFMRSMDIEVNTIDGFQGQEKDIIYISLVRSNDRSEIGFLADTRRLNVALTRARKKLIIVGDSATIGSNPVYTQLLNHIEKAASYQSAWEYMV